MSVVKQENGQYALFDNDLDLAIAVGTKMQMFNLKLCIEYPVIFPDTNLD